MSRPPREPPSPSAMVPALLRYLAARGRDPDAIAARLGLPPGAAELDELGVAPPVIGELLDAAAELLGEPHLALLLPGALPLRRYDVVELALRSSPTLRDGLAVAARHAASVHPHLAYALEEVGDEARWIQRTPRHPRGIGRHAHEYGLAYVLVHARAGLAGALAPSRAWFAHPRARSLEPVAALFGTEELAFGAPDSGFAFARRWLDAPLVGGDPRLLATVEALAAARPAPGAAAGSPALAPRVAAALRAASLADAGAGAVAAALHMSARTLQRRLEAEGTTFSGVLDATREALARELLADPELPLVEIAERVGFADMATFSRAFKRWTGKPPGQFRRS